MEIIVTVNSLLTNIASACILRNAKKVQIHASISYIKTNLKNHFQDNITGVIVFGSHSRNTILPREYDKCSDIDIMVIFKNPYHQPQTYLNQLKRFTESLYTQSQIKQSNPTVQLHMNHITFELVPAIRGLLGGLKIPAPSSNYINWIDTDPTGFNNNLIIANQNNSNLTKPLVRILKRWNAIAGYPYESYELEKQIVNNSPSYYTHNWLPKYFYDAVSSLDYSWLEAQWKKDKIEALKRATISAKQNEQGGNPYPAESDISKIIWV